MNNKENQLVAWFFVGPALGIIGLFFILPVIAALGLSLTDYDLYALADTRNLRFVGLHNYSEILHAHLYWKSLLNTVYFVSLGLPLSCGASLGCALLIHSKSAYFKGFYRTIFFIPVVTTLVAIAVVWRYIFNTRHGLINSLLAYLGITPIDWLGNGHLAILTLVFLAVWKNFGYNMFIFLAGLQSIPQELYDAAYVDGASSWQQLKHITLPMLTPMFIVVSIITISGYFQVFSEPYVITSGGPLQQTLTSLYYIYKEGFQWWHLGKASTISFILFVIIFIVTTCIVRFGHRKDWI